MVSTTIGNPGVAMPTALATGVAAPPPTVSYPTPRGLTPTLGAHAAVTVQSVGVPPPFIAPQVDPGIQPAILEQLGAQGGNNKRARVLTGIVTKLVPQQNFGLVEEDVFFQTR